MEVIGSTTSSGGYERVLALKRFAQPGHLPIFTGPALTLLAEQEDNLLVSTSPTLAALRDPEKSRQLFPRGKVWQVISRSPDDAVAHASLIFHHQYYNPLIEAWYDKLLAPILFAVV